MKKLMNLVVIIVIAFVAVNSIIGAFVYSEDYARITKLDYRAVVVDEENSNGKVIITERLTYEIHAASKSNLFWELWRDLPEEYIDGVKVEYKVNYVKQILDNGEEIVYGESPKLYWYDDDYINTAAGYGPEKWYHSKGPYDGERYFECVLFYVDGLYRETVVFEIEYEMVNASLRYLDSSELYLSLYYGDSIKYLNSVKGEILFPNEKMPRSSNYDAHTYGTNSHEFEFIESATINPGYHTFAFELNDEQLKFKPYNQYIEFALIAYGEDKHIFTQHAQENYYYNDNKLESIRRAQTDYEELPEKFIIFKTIVFCIFLVISVVILLISYFVNRIIKRKNTFYKPTLDIEYFRDIPSDLEASFANKLVFCKKNKTSNSANEYAATMLSLVYKGYLDLEQINSNKDWSSNNVKLIVKPLKENSDLDTDIRTALGPIEEQYYNLILRHSKGVEINLKDLEKKVSQDFNYTESFMDNVNNKLNNLGVSLGYFQKINYRNPRNVSYGFAVAIGMLGVFISIMANVISYQTRLDLAFGAFFILGGSSIVSALYLATTSKNYFLLTQLGEDEYVKWKGLYNFLNSDTLMNERTVLELVIWEKYLIYATAFGISKKVIKALEVRCPETAASPILRNRYFYSPMFYSNSRSFKTATRTASYTARSGGHGGYGGGGRGGGGGGGGH